MPASHYSLQLHFWYACQGIGGEQVMHCSLSRFHRSIFKGLMRGDREEPATLTLSGRACGAHARKSGARARRRFCFAF